MIGLAILLKRLDWWRGHRTVLWGGRGDRDIQVGSSEDRRRCAYLDRQARLSRGMAPLLATMERMGAQLTSGARALGRAAAKPDGHQ